MIKVQEVNLIEKEIIVNPYLTYAQIQQIVNAVIKFDTWAERQQNIDLLLLYHVTSLTKEQIEQYGHEELLCSGIIDEVKANVKNYGRIQEAIDYTQSTARALNQIVKELPTMLEPIKGKLGIVDGAKRKK